jgi:hypothetical protein
MRLQLPRILILSAASVSAVMGFLPVSLAPAAEAAHVAARPGGAPPAPPPPVITSTGKNIYQNGVATNYVGTPGQFTLSDTGQVTGYIYSFGSPSVGSPVPAGPDGKLTLAITPNSIFVLNLYAQAVNGSSPPSQPSLFAIENIAKDNIATLAWWKLNASRRGVAADATGNGHAVALSKGQAVSCAKSPAPDGFRCALRLNGRGDAQTSPALLSTIFTGWNFTVSAWVNLARCATTCVALSQDGLRVSMLTLGYKARCALDKHGCWVFQVRPGDDPGTIPMTALAPVGRRAPFGRWVQLTGEIDTAEARGPTLYVNGALRAQNTKGNVVPPNTNGVLRLGAGFGGRHRWTGELSNACVFFNALLPADVTTLYKGDSAHPRDGCAALLATYP